MRTLLCVLFVACTTGLRIHNSAPTENMGQCPEDGITAAGHRDGFGATYSSMIGVYMYAAMKNRTYCTTPWTHQKHGVNMDEMFEWVGGSELGPPATSKTEKMINYLQYWRTDPYYSQLTDLMLEKRQRISDAYFGRLNEKKDASLNLFGASDKTSKNVAWHIRRGDVHSPRKRYTNNSEIVGGLKELNKTHPLKVVHFFSEGDEKDFEPINHACKRLEIECIWHLNASVKATHYSLSIADVLVMARSSFSASAGLLNRGAVFRDLQLLPGRKREEENKERDWPWNIHEKRNRNSGPMQPMDRHAQWEHMNNIFVANFAANTNDKN